MDFQSWLGLVQQAGADPRRIDQMWLQSQFGSGVSPADVARVIKNNQAPAAQPQYQQQPMQPMMQQPYFAGNPNAQIPYGDPRAMKFPADRGEWVATAGVMTLLLLGSLVYFNILLFGFRALKGDPADFFAKTAIPLALILLAGVLLRRLFKFSPNCAWNGRKFGITLGLLIIGIQGFFELMMWEYEHKPVPGVRPHTRGPKHDSRDSVLCRSYPGGYWVGDDAAVSSTEPESGGFYVFCDR